jgi:hypothetical protein
LAKACRADSPSERDDFTRLEIEVPAALTGQVAEASCGFSVGTAAINDEILCPRISSRTNQQR